MAGKVEQIAARSGVSKAVVSSVLNGGIGNIGYSRSTRRRVIETAQLLDYRPTERHSIGVVCCVSGTPTQEVDWVGRISPMLGAIHSQAMAEHKLVSVFGFSLKELEAVLAPGRTPPIFRRQKVDGLIVAGAWNQTLQAELDEIQLPYVRMNNTDGHTLVEDSVTFDEEFTGRQITEHLLGLGHKRIMHISVQWTSEHYSVDFRRRGYERAMAEVGLTPNVVHHQSGDDELVGLRDVLAGPDRPTAVFAYNEKIALGCCRLMREMGIRPDELSIMTASRGDEQLMLWSGLTSVNLPADEMGRQSYLMLLRKLATGERIPAITLRGRVVDRGSARPLQI